MNSNNDTYSFSVPGFFKDEITITLKNNRLDIVAEQKEQLDRIKLERFEHTLWLPSNFRYVEAKLYFGTLDIIVYNAEAKVTIPIA